MIFGPEIKAVMFDMDGVLWHSSAIHAAAYKAVLDRAGLTMPDYAQIAGRRTDDVMRELLSAQRRADAGVAAVMALTAQKQALARQMLRDKAPLAPDCAAVLGYLTRTKALALASSASAGTVDLFLDASGTRALFAAVISGGDVAAAKPHPAIYLKALERLGRGPCETAVVEDAPSGVEAARAAGIECVIAVEGTAPRAALVQAGAQQVVRNLTELVAA